MVRVYLTLTLVTIVSLLAGACARPSCGGEWQDILWTLESYGPPGNLQPVLENTGITLRFDSREKQLNGSGGCNQYFGSFNVKGNCRLEITGLSSTVMGCLEPGIMEQEQKYFNLLQNAGTIAVRGEELRISSGLELLVFKH